MKKNVAGCLLVLLMCLVGQQAKAQAFYKVNELAEIVAAAFKADDHQALDRLATRLRTEKSRTPSGLWNLSVFYSGVVQAMLEGREENSSAQWSNVEARLNRWVAAYPHSAFFPIALAQAQARHGWALRGSGFADKVTERGWEGFARQMAAASATLRSNKGISSGDPQWYVQMLGVALAQGWDEAPYMALYEEAVAREPLYYQTYFSALERLLPMWGGDVQKIRSFAADAVRRTAATEGQGMYARIYWVASARASGVFLKEPNRSAVWPQMKAGFNDLITQYPDDWNRNAYAKVACQAGDVDIFIGMVATFEQEPIKDAWPKDYFQRCKAYALQVKPWAHVKH